LFGIHRKGLDGKDFHRLLQEDASDEIGFGEGLGREATAKIPGRYSDKGKILRNIWAPATVRCDRDIRGWRKYHRGEEKTIKK